MEIESFSYMDSKSMQNHGILSYFERLQAIMLLTFEVQLGPQELHTSTIPKASGLPR